MRKLRNVALTAALASAAVIVEASAALAGVAWK